MTGAPRRVLLVDNYDSFTMNIAQSLGCLGALVEVARNDDLRLSPGWVRSFAGVVIGPGPGTPWGAGRSLDVIAWCCDVKRPVLGVCLGHQAIGTHFGARVGRAPRPMHGKTSVIDHDGTGVFFGVPAGLVATRYHSLCLAPDALDTELRVNAVSDDGVVQGFAHRSLPVHGVQFHPESVLTDGGATIFANFLEMLSNSSRTGMRAAGRLGA